MDLKRWARGERFVTEHHDRELGATTRVSGVVLDVDELAELAFVRLDGGHETWIAVELLAEAVNVSITLRCSGPTLTVLP